MSMDFMLDASNNDLNTTTHFISILDVPENRSLQLNTVFAKPCLIQYCYWHSIFEANLYFYFSFA